MTPYRGVIFDIDGTLVDSNDGHARAWVRAFADAGFEVPFEQVRPLIGMGRSAGAAPDGDREGTPCLRAA
ncbi:HAD family hydrolase [Deinococcus malanensis]|uniref:HAD family hydrolase n=1 Tax=Deinococcus malanensis TaxID=1706855 RepID=UPI003640A27C